MSRRMKQRFDLRRQWPEGAVSVRLVVGLLVVLLGVLVLISNLHIFDSYSPTHYFLSLALVAIGGAVIIERRTERSWQWGLGWIVAGIWMFAYQRRWIDVSFFEIVVPLIMLAGGAYLVRRAINERYEQDNAGGQGQGDLNDPNNPSNPGPGNTGGPSGSGAPRRSNYVHAIGVLSASEQKPARPIAGADLFALMGGVKLDLFDAQLINNTMTIHVGACMGGIEICAPSDWIVTSRVLPIMGAFIDKRRPATVLPGGDQTKTLLIDGFVLMGGIEIKN